MAKMGKKRTFPAKRGGRRQTAPAPTATATATATPEVRREAPSADALPRVPLKTKRTCGDYGGRLDDGSPCTHVAGWGNFALEGRCKYHTAQRDEKVEEAKVRFLDALAGGTISLAAASKSIGWAVSTVWRWRQLDQDFDQKVRQAIKSADAMRVSLVEDSLFDRIVKGEAKASETIFYLVNRGRGRWKHLSRIEHTGAGGTPLPATGGEMHIHLYLPDNQRQITASARAVVTESASRTAGRAITGGSVTVVEDEAK